MEETAKGENITEEMFLDESGITVTNTHFTAHGHTYDMSAITSLKCTRTRTFRHVCFFAALLSISLLLTRYALWSVALIALALLAHFLKDKYYITLTTASGEKNALITTDSALVSKIEQALNQTTVTHS
jgi:hypothetical protein